MSHLTLVIAVFQIFLLILKISESAVNKTAVIKDRKIKNSNIVENSSSYIIKNSSHINIDNSISIDNSTFNSTYHVRIERSDRRKQTCKIGKLCNITIQTSDTAIDETNAEDANRIRHYKLTL